MTNEEIAAATPQPMIVTKPKSNPSNVPIRTPLPLFCFNKK